MKVYIKTLVFILVSALPTFAADQPKYFENLMVNTVSATAQNGTDGLKLVMSSELDRLAENSFKKFFTNSSGVTEVSIQGMSGSTPTYNILLLRPITEQPEKLINSFLQTSLFYQDNRSTYNLGYGLRSLFFEKKLLAGANVFYDHEFPYNHQRMSLGGELRTTAGEVNANYYNGLSNWKRTKEGLDEKALGGYDLEVGIALPYINTAHIRVKTFKWNGYEGGNDVKGQTYSLTGQIYSGLSIEAGRTHFNNQEEDTNFVKISYNIPLGVAKKASTPLTNYNSPYTLDSMDNRIFEKVRRENKIIKQVGRNFNIKLSGV